jgi:hypothetical protein
VGVLQTKNVKRNTNKSPTANMQATWIFFLSDKVNLSICEIGSAIMAISREIFVAVLAQANALRSIQLPFASPV